MSPKEIARISAVVSPAIKTILESESTKIGLSQTEYLERLIEGTLPNRIEAKIEELRKEILELKDKK